jgi:DNA-binding NarL/FixJ family response regulator
MSVPSSPPRIILIEDHTLVRQLLAALIRDHLHTEPAGEANSVAEGLDLARRVLPDLMVVDWSLPDGNAADIIQAVAPEFPSIRWLVISARDDETVLRAALALGVHGIVLKQSPLETFLEAMKQVLEGGSFYCPRSSRLLVESLRSDAPVLGSSLTLREREILRGLARGLNLKEIAHLADCSAKTIQNQTSQLKDKLGIRDPAGLILYAQRNGLTA